MDLRKEILTGMLRTTGSKRVSVIIQDKKGRYLIAERAGVAEGSMLLSHKVQQEIGSTVKVQQNPFFAYCIALNNTSKEITGIYADL